MTTITTVTVREFRLSGHCTIHPNRYEPNAQLSQYNNSFTTYCVRVHVNDTAMFRILH